MKANSFVLAIIAMACVTSLQAQKLSEGNLNFLKGTERLNVVIDYSDMLIQGNPEQTAYELKGEEWAEKWETAKETSYPKEFIAHLNKNLNIRKAVLPCGDYPEAEYQATVRVLTVGRIWGIECEVIFTKTGESLPLAVVKNLKGDSRRWGGIGGGGSNTYLTGTAFAFAGQNLGVFMAKSIR
ncbi:MAG: hypothetical protein LBK07_10575 [Tannerella sp.]|jgi:hypothetical protein|nr:hypothetical protein [Tannerella sp.]